MQPIRESTGGPDGPPHYKGLPARVRVALEVSDRLTHTFLTPQHYEEGESWKGSGGLISDVAVTEAEACYLNALRVLNEFLGAESDAIAPDPPARDEDGDEPQRERVIQ